MIYNAVQGFKNNHYHTQEVVGSLCVAAFVKLGSNHIQQITNLTAFASAASGASCASLLVAAHSAPTFWPSEDSPGKSTAKKVFLVAIGMLSIAAFLKRTTILKTRHISFPALSEFAKPFAAATAATVLLTQAGITGIKVASKAFTKSEDTENKGTEDTENKGTEDTENKGTEDTENKSTEGTESTENKGTEDTENKSTEGTESTENKGTEGTETK